MKAAGLALLSHWDRHQGKSPGCLGDAARSDSQHRHQVKARPAASDKRQILGTAFLIETRTMDEQTCSSCGHTKAAEEFRPMPSGNRRAKCKDCERAEHRARYAAMEEKPHQRPDMKAYYRAWYAKNRDRLIAKAAAYNQAHPEMRRDVCRENMRRDRAKLGERYVRRMLAQEMGLRSKDIPQPLVAAQRELLNIKRYLKGAA